ncbi:ribosomal RNA processing protein 7 [Scheffersomyces xylosifermentans]|uniref:ribosomal RNA processing protein 7 n=1 Tax=Scheffersomyces xylosifermentans TaxID=1304137 RepID=UPI00315C7C6A
MAVTELKGFYVLPVSSPKSQVPHYIFFKKHDSKNSGSSTNNGRALFMCNLPVATSTASLKKFFQEVAIGATIESFVPSLLNDCPLDVWVNLTKLTSDLELNPELLSAQNADEEAAKLPKNCGIVSFVDKSAFQLAFNSLKKLSASAKTTPWTFPTFDSKYYLQRYQAKILDPEVLSESVSQALVDFDRAERESKEALQQQTQLVDEDGFTLVVGSHRKTKAGIMGKQKLAATVEVEKAQNKMKKKEKEDFYRFQLRQRKKDEMNELLQKFKLDQEKVRMMKEKKRFRPY